MITPAITKPARRRPAAAVPYVRHRQSAAAMKKIPQKNADRITGCAGFAVQISAADSENSAILPNESGARSRRIIPATNNGSQLQAAAIPIQCALISVFPLTRPIVAPQSEARPPAPATRSNT